nr:MAG TPA: PrcB C-terminal [Caudoviricetes sp.]
MYLTGKENFFCNCMFIEAITSPFLMVRGFYVL